MHQKATCNAEASKRLTVNAHALKTFLKHQYVQWLMQEEQEERLHAQRMLGGLQDAELALEIRASLLDATPWAPQVLLIPCSSMHTPQPACMLESLCNHALMSGVTCWGRWQVCKRLPG